MADSTDLTAQTSGPINIDLAKGNKTIEDWIAASTRTSVTREVTAKWIAIGILAMAAGSLVILLCYGFKIILTSMNQPEHTKSLILDSVIPFIEKVATFFTTVFSPLLAFILGYYFGQRQAQRRATD